MSSVLLEKTSIMEPTMDEEDSHFFLRESLSEQWYSYTSKDHSLDDVVKAIENFILLHACIFLPEVGLGKFWTPTPLEVFKYVMDSEGNWNPISEFNPFNGYKVQGCYWANGFYYLVSYDNFLLEANLYVDFHTKETYNYQ